MHILFIFSGQTAKYAQNLQEEDCIALQMKDNLINLIILIILKE